MSSGLFCTWSCLVNRVCSCQTQCWGSTGFVCYGCLQQGTPLLSRRALVPCELAGQQQCWLQPTQGVPLFETELQQV